MSLKDYSAEKIAKHLRERGYEIELDHSRYTKVEIERENVGYFLKHKSTGYSLVYVWDTKCLNDFEEFDYGNAGHLIIDGNVTPFEIIDSKTGEKVLEGNKTLIVRFLKKTDDED